MIETAKTRIAGVIGDPVSHSLSPKLHGYWLDKYQIDGRYEAWQITTKDLELFLKTKLPELILQKGYKGCNVTIPHKEAAFGICQKFHEISDEACIIRAVNTISFNYHSKLLYGDNSDGKGFIKNIKNHYPDFNFKNKKVVILGSGGAARAVCYSLIKEQPLKITITNRNYQRALELINDFYQNTPDHINCKILSPFPCSWNEKEKILSDCDFLINTTSLGMNGQEELEIDLNNLSKSALVCDIVYKPLMTKLLTNAKSRGNEIVTGIGMLINQAVFGFEAWYGIKPEVDLELTDKIIKWSRAN